MPETGGGGGGGMTDLQLAILIHANGAWGPGGSRAPVENFLDIAYAVMMGESGGNTSARNGSSSAAGLFQIMQSIHKPTIDRAIRKYSTDEYKATINDPRVNIECARVIWNDAGKKWTPWEAYNKQTPAYKAARGHGKAMWEYLDSLNSTQMARAYMSVMSGMVEVFRPSILAASLGAGTKSVDDLTPAEVLEAVFGAGMAGVKEAFGQGSGAIGDAVAKLDPIDRFIDFVKKGAPAIGGFMLGLILLILGLWFLISQSKTAKTALGVVPGGKILKAVS